MQRRSTLYLVASVVCDYPQLRLYFEFPGIFHFGLAPGRFSLSSLPISIINTPSPPAHNGPLKRNALSLTPLTTSPHSSRLFNTCNSPLYREICHDPAPTLQPHRIQHSASTPSPPSPPQHPKHHNNSNSHINDTPMLLRQQLQNKKWH
jgi:hypothetical protein